MLENKGLLKIIKGNHDLKISHHEIEKVIARLFQPKMQLNYSNQLVSQSLNAEIHMNLERLIFLMKN